ncbi:WD40/YVTN/BNR-like repeat-containing protein [Salegentibacter sp. F14]
MNKKLLFIFLISPFFVIGQKLDMSLVQNMEPRNIGPAGMSGRITAIDAVTANPDIIYAGSASGGLWKSTSGGVKWEPVFEDEETASIGAIAIQQSNPSIVWVGTGEGNPRNSLNGGAGIYKSLDGGKSWERMGLENTRHIHRVVIDPVNPNTVYAGAIGSPWGEHTERGVYKTTDGGQTWKKILYTNQNSGVAELVMDPENPNKLFAAIWEHKREPWFFKSGGAGSGLYVTYNGGESWEEITEKNGLPEGELGRIGLAIAPGKPQVVYAYVESKKNGLYRSEDGGETWDLVNDDMGEIGNRPFYYAEIYVAPNNENRVYSIFTFVNVSQDGGHSFEELMPSYGANNGIHPDHHAWYIHPENPNFMIDGNDGGLNITRDGGQTWQFVENIPVGQFYHVAVDNETPYNVYGGMQDNGSWKGPAYVWKSQGIRNSYWQEISFGDGFDVVPDPDNSRYGWSMSQQGNVARYDSQTGNNYVVKPTHPDPDVELRYNWNAAIHIDPFDSNTLYFGSQFVHKSSDKGLTWEVISPDLTTNDPQKQKQMESGGLTIDATGAENHTTLLVIEPSPIEKDMLWTGSDDGKVYYTRNAGKNWVDVSGNLRGLPEGSWIAQIKASNKKKGEALLVANNYRRDDYTPYVYRTRNYGESWDRIVDKEDVLSFALSIVEDPKEENLLFLGTDDGLYVSVDAGDQWEKWTNGFPTVPVKDMVIHPRENDLIIGTFGRSFWILDDIRPLREIAKDKAIITKVKVDEPRLKVFPTPTAYLAANQQPSGSRFPADAIYSGENRGKSARISYFIRPKKAVIEDHSEEKTKEEQKREKASEWDTLSLNIYDGARLIRTLKREAPDSVGVYTISWAMDEKGAESPTRKIIDSKEEPGGVAVRPGTYRVVMKYGILESEAEINVEMDPRLNISEKAISELYDTEKEIEEMSQVAADAVKQLVQSKNTASTFKEKLKKEDSLKYKNEIKISQTIVDTIENKIALFLGEEDERQGIVRSREMTVHSRLNQARYYVRSRPDGLTSTENTLMAHAENDLREALEKVNLFFETKWPEYRLKMEKIEISPFKEVELFELSK